MRYSSAKESKRMGYSDSGTGGVADCFGADGARVGGVGMWPFCCVCCGLDVGRGEGSDDGMAGCPFTDCCSC